MKFRKNHYLSRRKSSNLSILLILPLLLIFFSTTVLQALKKPKMSPSVRFDTIPVDEKGVIRFAAVDPSTGSKISFKDWIHIISDPNSSDVARNMATILKVCMLETSY